MKLKLNNLLGETRTLTSFDTRATNVHIDIPFELGETYASSFVYRVRPVNEVIPSNVTLPSAITEWPVISWGEIPAAGTAYTLMCDFVETAQGKWTVHWGYGQYNDTTKIVTPLTIAPFISEELFATLALWKSYNANAFIETDYTEFFNGEEIVEIESKGFSTDLDTIEIKTGLNAIAIPANNLNKFTSYFGERIEVLHMSTEFVDSTIIVILIFKLQALNYVGAINDVETNVDNGSEV